MAIFDRFKRKQKVILPEEVNQYYQSQRRERVGVAVILGIVALIITLLVALTLFFGGRFIYRKFAGNDAKQKPTTIKVEPATPANKSNDASPSAGQSAASSAANQGNTNTQTANTPAPAPSTPAPASTPTTTPNLGDNTSSTLPHTGDEGH